MDFYVNNLNNVSEATMSNESQNPNQNPEAPVCEAAATPGYQFKPGEVVVIDYVNYRGERSVRRILPLGRYMFFGADKFHTEPQWLLPAMDLDKGAMRTFALRDIKEWWPESSYADRPCTEKDVREHIQAMVEAHGYDSVGQLLSCTEKLRAVETRARDYIAQYRPGSDGFAEGSLLWHLDLALQKVKNHDAAVAAMRAQIAEDKAAAEAGARALGR